MGADDRSWGDEFQTQRRKGCTAGHVRKEELLAKAVTHHVVFRRWEDEVLAKKSPVGQGDGTARTVGKTNSCQRLKKVNRPCSSKKQVKKLSVKRMRRCKWAVFWTVSESWINERGKLSSNCERSTNSRTCLRILLLNERKCGAKTCRTFSKDGSTSYWSTNKCRSGRRNCGVYQTQKLHCEKNMDRWAKRNEQFRTEMERGAGRNGRQWSNNSA